MDPRISCSQDWSSKSRLSLTIPGENYVIPRKRCVKQDETRTVAS